MREETSETKRAGEAEDDALFAHLGELVERLPQMQAAQARLDRAQTAAEILRLDREHQTCAAMLAMANEALAKAQVALEAAQAAGDEEDATVEQARREVMFRASERGFRIGPEQNARLALERALADSPFASAEEARTAAIAPDEEAALREEIASYQQDYATTLARCQQLEGNENA